MPPPRAEPGSGAPSHGSCRGSPATLFTTGSPAGPQRLSVIRGSRLAKE